MPNSHRPLVLQVRSSNATGGGADTLVFNATRYLPELGYDTICAYLHPPADGPALAERAASFGARFVSVPDRHPVDWRVVRQLIGVCRREKVAIWHSNEYKSNILGLIVRRFWPMRLVSTVHGWVEHTWKTPFYYSLDKFCLRRYDKVICVSRDLEEECLRCGVRTSRCHLIDNAVDTRDFCRTQSRDEAKQAINAPNGGILLGAMGRLSPEKGFDLLIRAADILIHRGHDITLWIAGEGRARPELERLIADLGQSERIRLLGHLSDAKTFLQAIDGFVLSSLREGLPMVVLEAMSLQVPVLATRVAGVPSLIQDGENGLLIESGSVEELVSGLIRLLADGDNRHRIAQQARRTIEATYGFEGRMKQITSIYDWLLNGTLAYKNTIK